MDLIQILPAIGRRRQCAEGRVLIVDFLDQLLDGARITSIPCGSERRERRDVRDGPPEGRRHCGLVFANLGNCAATNKAVTASSAVRPKDRGVYTHKGTAEVMLASAAPSSVGLESQTSRGTSHEEPTTFTPLCWPAVKSSPWPRRGSTRMS